MGVECGKWVYYVEFVQKDNGEIVLEDFTKQPKVGQAIRVDDLLKQVSELLQMRGDLDG